MRQPSFDAVAHAQSAMNPSGPQAERIAGLSHFAFTTAAIVYVLVMIALVWALTRARRRASRDTPLPPDADRRMTRSVATAVGATVAVLLVFLSYDLAVGRAMTPAPVKNPVTIQLVGHMWWWEAVYPDSSNLQNQVSTANEIHVPVGEPVLLILQSRDVIHSVWLPQLAGKKDLIPGYTQTLWFTADTAGVYRGQCAEFCGYQHAHMSLLVIAEPRAQYEAWRAASAKPAPPTAAGTLAAQGQQVFLTRSCVMCHTVAGTPAGSRAGPDLTHIGSRQTIAAVTLPNTADNLRRWIRNPQQIKPGTNMPATPLSSAELDALVAYLQQLR